ncbi:MAG: hypothetical protein ACLUQ6_06920 [Alistipes onderdonkii]
MLGALAALLPAGAAAQQSDARQRTTETIVADGLAQLPAADAKVFQPGDGRTGRHRKQGCRDDRRHARPCRQGQERHVRIRP